MFLKIISRCVNTYSPKENNPHISNYVVNKKQNFACFFCFCLFRYSSRYCRLLPEVSWLISMAEAVEVLEPILSPKSLQLRSTDSDTRRCLCKLCHVTQHVGEHWMAVESGRRLSKDEMRGRILKSCCLSTFRWLFYLVISDVNLFPWKYINVYRNIFVHSSEYNI